MNKLSISAADLATRDELVVTLSDGTCRLLTADMVQAIPVHVVQAILGVPAKDAGCLDGAADAQKQSDLEIEGFYNIPA